MNWFDIALENLIASLPIEIGNRVWWWANLNFETIGNAALFALAVVPALIGLGVGLGLAYAIKSYKTLPLGSAKHPQILAILGAVLLLPGLPFKALFLVLAGVMGLPLLLPFGCAAFSQILTFYLAVYMTRDAAVLGWLLQFFGLLPS